MCLMVMALRVHREYPLILAANRDEFDDRPFLPARFWPEAPWVLAGRDERGGGSWLGVSSRGRLALVTNVRDPSSFNPNRPSRGDLVADYLLEKGVRDPQEIIVEGKGAQEPVASNETPEGMRKNRRVEITILEN